MALIPPPGFRGVFRSDDDARAVYAEAAGIGRYLPRAVAAPRDAADVIALVRWAARDGVSLVARGSGSSMAGGAIGDGVIVDVSRMRAMGPVDTAARAIRVGPGALRGEVERAARAVGLRVPVDPSSGEFCTIGGMVATNAAGAHSLKFGATRAWVRALDCVFSDGGHAELRRGAATPRDVAVLDRFTDLSSVMILERERASPSVHAGVHKDSSGYGTAAYARSGELVDLLAGSEGSLAFFVGIELALTPLAPATSSILGAFGSLDDAVRAAIRARATGVAACELLDRTFLEIASAGGLARTVPAGTESALLAEVEGDNVREVEAGFECGIGLEGFNDIKVGDTIEAFKIVESKRKL